MLLFDNVHAFFIVLLLQFFALRLLLASRSLAALLFGFRLLGPSGPVSSSFAFGLLTFLLVFLLLAYLFGLLRLGFLLFFFFVFTG